MTTLPVLRRPRALGIACAIVSVLLGLAYLAAAGAPTRYLGINFGALIVGLVAVGLVGRAAPVASRATGILILAMATALLATALAGDAADGAARWVSVGGLAVQPSLILLPAMILAFAAAPGALAAGGLMVASAALALHPDRAMAGMLAAGLTVLAATRPDRRVLAALGAALAGFAVTLVRPDALPAAPFVDRILFTSFAVHPLAGMAVVGGAALLVLPAMAGWQGDPAGRPRRAVFAAVWLAAIAAAALGNYPTPMVGYGGSVILGYLLSLLALPSRTAAHLSGEPTSECRKNTERMHGGLLANAL